MILRPGRQLEAQPAARCPRRVDPQPRAATSEDNREPRRVNPSSASRRATTRTRQERQETGQGSEVPSEASGMGSYWSTVAAEDPESGLSGLTASELSDLDWRRAISARAERLGREGIVFASPEHRSREPWLLRTSSTGRSVDRFGRPRTRSDRSGSVQPSDSGSGGSVLELLLGMCQCGRTRAVAVAGIVVLLMVLGVVAGYSATGERRGVTEQRSGSSDIKQRFAVLAERTHTSTERWAIGSQSPEETPAIRIGEGQDGPADVWISLVDFVCRLVEHRLVCYTPLQQRCVVLRKGRSDKPSEVVARRGVGSPMPICNSYELFFEK